MSALGQRRFIINYTCDLDWAKTCVPMLSNFAIRAGQSGTSLTRVAITSAGCSATNRLSSMDRAVLWAIAFACTNVAASI